MCRVCKGLEMLVTFKVRSSDLLCWNGVLGLLGYLLFLPKVNNDFYVDIFRRKVLLWVSLLFKDVRRIYC